MTSVFSDRWHHVAALRPTLSPRALVRRQRVRGATWRLLQVAGAPALRLNEAAWDVAGRMTGAATVAELWSAAVDRGEHAPTQDELLDLLARLREHSLVSFDAPGDAARALALLARTRAAHEPGHAFAALSWRVRLLDPSRLLAPLRPLAMRAFSRAGAAVVAAAVLLLALLAALHAPAIAAHARTWMGTPRYVWLAIALYVPVKAVHELAHGLAVLRFGGRVRAAGVTFMALLPAPWVDASAAAAFPRRRDRVVVGAAGMLAELVLACVALCAWLRLDDGTARDAAFVLLAITGVSTLAFNANPLQRLDGYFVLVDLLGLPNLASRSRTWWLQALRRRLLGQDVEPFHCEPGERAWLAAYAPAAWAFGIVVAAWAVRWLGGCSAVLGLAVGALLGWQAVVAPAWRLLRELGRAAAQRAAATRRWRAARALLALGLALALGVPVPHWRTVPGIAWPDDDALLRAGEDGFVDAVAAGPSAPVHAGEVVLWLSNPALQARLERADARVAALQARLLGAVGDETGDAAPRSAAGATGAADARAELAAAQAEQAQLAARVEALAVRAQRDGRIEFDVRGNLVGRYLRRGALVGQVLTGAPPRVRVAWPQAIPLPADGGRDVEVRLADGGGEVVAGRLEGRVAGGAVDRLPGAALSQRHGGPIATDPADRDDLRPLQPVVLLDVRLQGAGRAADRIGQRGLVRLREAARPWGWTLLQAARREFVQRFSARS